MEKFLVEFPKLGKKFQIQSQNETTAWEWVSRQLEVFKVEKTRTIVTKVIDTPNE